MNIVSCFSPVRIVPNHSHYLDALKPWKNSIYVPCGKCDACLNRKMLSAVDRIEQENKKHKWCYHVTCTINEESAHFMRFEKVTDSLVVAYWSDWFNFFNGKMYPKVWRTFQKPDDKYIYSDQYEAQEWQDALKYAECGSAYGDNKLRYSTTRDMQLFLKRLRRRIDYRYGKTKAIRFYAVFELSPEKLRPHWHVLLWFDDDAIAKDIRFLVSESWQNGFTKCKLATGRQRKYVAKYVNSISHYPKIFLNKDTFPHTLASRFPAIGSYEVPTSEIREAYERRNFAQVLPRNNKVEDLQFSQSFESRWFPKCREFSSLSHCDRVRVYSIYSQVHRTFKLPSDSKRLNRDLLFLADSDIVTYVNEPSNLVAYDEKKCILGISDYYVSRRVYEIADFFNFSIDKVVRIIEDYYSFKELRNLKQFYEFQRDFVEDYPDKLHFLASLYPTACDDWFLALSHSFRYSKQYFKTLGYFARSVHLTEKNKNDFKHSLIYQSFVARHKRMSKDNMKSKTFNDLINQFDKI